MLIFVRRSSNIEITPWKHQQIPILSTLKFSRFKFLNILKFKSQYFFPPGRVLSGTILLGYLATLKSHLWKHWISLILLTLKISKTKFSKILKILRPKISKNLHRLKRFRCTIAFISQIRRVEKPLKTLVICLPKNFYEFQFSKIFKLKRQYFLKCVNFKPFFTK